MQMHSHEVEFESRVGGGREVKPDVGLDGKQAKVVKSAFMVEDDRR